MVEKNVTFKTLPLFLDEFKKFSIGWTAAKWAKVMLTPLTKPKLMSCWYQNGHIWFKISHIVAQTFCPKYTMRSDLIPVKVKCLSVRIYSKICSQGGDILTELTFEGIMASHWVCLFKIITLSNLRCPFLTSKISIK